jgi:predicted DNA-binding transcriptional regulator AlpA
VAEPVDPDDLLDANDVAELAGWARRNAVQQYRDRHPDEFPAPAVTKRSGVLWRRRDILEWMKRTGRPLPEPAQLPQLPGTPGEQAGA